MDLPSCPACGQSVLDDDADECPFCGASMSGKPAAVAKSGAVATAPARTEPARATAKPAAAKRPVAPLMPETKPESDDPFEMERSAEASRKVVQLRPQPEQGRRHEVKCPMCETVGYTGRKAAGMDVKCANPNCKFPYFTAPPLADGDEDAAEKSAAADAGPAKKSLVTRERIIAYTLIGVVGVFALWFFAFRKPSRPTTPGGNNIGQAPRNGNPENPNDHTNVVDPGIKKTKVDPREELLAIRRDALKMMVTHSGQTDPARVFEKSLSWQWTVDAHARTGDVSGANSHMQQLRVVTSTGPFYQALPLAAIAWQHLHKATDEAKKAAQESLDAALAAARRLPQNSRQRYDIVSNLAAALFVTGRPKDAETLLAANSDPDAPAQASLFAHRLRLLESYNAEAALLTRAIDPPQSPQRISVTLILAGHKRWKHAWDWAVSQQGAVRDECITAWAEMRFGSGTYPIDPPQPEKKGGKAPPKDPQALPGLLDAAARLSSAAARGTLFARVAFRLKDSGKSEDAGKSLAFSREALKGITSAAEPKTPAIKDVVTYQLPPDREIRRANSCALAELARAELRLDPKPAWPTLSRGLAVARSIAPSPADVADLVKNQNSVPVRLELARITRAEGDALDLQVKRYVRGLQPIQEASKFRFDLTTRLFVAAANWGAADKHKSPQFLQSCWKDVDARRQKTASIGREDWQTTRVPWLLAGNLETAGESEAAARIRKNVGRHRSRRQYTWDEFRAAIKANGFEAAARALTDRRLDANWANETLLTQVVRYADAGELPAGKKLIREFRDPVIKMEALRLLAARAAVRGKAKDVWAAINDDTLESPQKVALCHGLVLGMSIPEAAKKKP